jgi:hypothetical protein
LVTWATIQPVWPVLALLAYILVNCVLAVLAAQRRHALDVYDRVRASKKLRTEYLTSLANRQNPQEY